MIKDHLNDAMKVIALTELSGIPNSTTGLGLYHELVRLAQAVALVTGTNYQEELDIIKSVWMVRMQKDNNKKEV